MSETGKVYQVQYPATVSGKVYNVRDVSGDSSVSGKVYQVANIAGGGVTINNQDIDVTENGVYTADAGYTGLGTVNVNVPTGSATINNQDINVTENGVYTAAAGYTGLGTVNVNVPTGGGGAPATKFGGVSFDDMLGGVDENGDYREDTALFTVDLSGVKKVGNNGYVYYPEGGFVYLPNSFAYKFYNKKNLVGTIDLSNITYGNIGHKAFESAFEGSGVEVVYLPKNTGDFIYMQRAFAYCNRLHTVYIQGADFGDKLDPDEMFDGCKNLERVYGVENIVKMQLHYTFRSCEKLSGELHFDSLEAIVGNCYNGLRKAKITKVFFPKLTSFSGTSCLGTRSGQYIFEECSALVEIHFRADMQATVEALGGYSAKWGATNASIIFDL